MNQTRCALLHTSLIPNLAGPAGFEPAISTLRGCRPRPLDDGASLVPQREFVHRRNAQDYSSFPLCLQIGRRHICGFATITLCYAGVLACGSKVLSFYLCIIFRPVG